MSMEKYMPPIEHNGPDFFYQVYWKRKAVDLDWQIVKIPQWDKTEHVVEQQPTFQPYLIKVEAHNARGPANVAAVEHTGYSGEDRPLEKPEDLTLVQIKNANTAVFRWRPVSPESVRGHFKGYKIQTWTREEGPERMRELIVAAEKTEAEANRDQLLA